MAKKEAKKKQGKTVDPVLEGPKDMVLANGEKITLRPFTFGSLTLAHKLGLTIFTGEGEEPDPDSDVDDEMLGQLQTFIWMQSQPIDDVLHHVRYGDWEDAVLEFSFNLPLHEAQTLFSEIQRISDLAGEAAVDVLPKDSDSDDDTPGE